MDILKKVKRVKRQDKTETNNFDHQGNTIYRWDYVKTVFLWKMSEPHETIKDTEYPSYFEKELGIKFPGKFHEQMISEGFLVKSDYFTSLNLYTAQEIKAIAEAVGMSAKEDKDVLIAGLIEKLNENDLSRICMDVYEISEKGKRFIEKNKEYIQMYQQKNDRPLKANKN